jgi:hypothetical protein
MKTVHLIVKYEFYDAIERGDKTIEYRTNNHYWRRRIVGIKQDASDQARTVTFHRGYSKETMTFEINYIVLGEVIEIHLGRRLEQCQQ